MNKKNFLDHSLKRSKVVNKLKYFIFNLEEGLYCGNNRGTRGHSNCIKEQETFL